MKEARSAEIFVQICNHNYLLADAAHRLQELRPLLNDYRALVIDEAHKLPDAARQMYGQSLSAEDLHELCSLLTKEKYIGWKTGLILWCLQKGALLSRYLLVTLMEPLSNSCQSWQKKQA